MAFGLHLTPLGPGIHSHCPDYPDLFLVLICTQLLNHMKPALGCPPSLPSLGSFHQPVLSPAQQVNAARGREGGQEAAEVTMEPFSRAEIRNWSAHNVPSFSKGPLFLWGKVGAFFHSPQICQTQASLVSAALTEMLRVSHIYCRKNVAKLNSCSQPTLKLC